MNRPQAHLIDISGVFFRYYFAPGPEIINEAGWDVGPLLGSVRWLLNQDSFFQSDVVVAAFDESLGTGYRHVLDPDYKANRPPPTDDILYLFSAIKACCEAMGFQALASPVYEADDLIAVCADQLPDHHIVIHSRDKDLRQLLTEQIEQVDFVSGKQWTKSQFLSEEGIEPLQVPLYLALVGDASDNITGIPGIGDKTAKTLLQTYAGWAEMYQAAAEEEVLPMRGVARIRQQLLEFAELVPHNLALTMLSRQSDIATVALRKAPNVERLQSLCEEFGISRPLSKLLQRLKT